MNRCPTHPAHQAEDCPICEQRIERAEYEREHGDDHAWQVGQSRYERWLNETGGMG